MEGQLMYTIRDSRERTRKGEFRHSPPFMWLRISCVSVFVIVAGALATPGQSAGGASAAASSGNVGKAFEAAGSSAAAQKVRGGMGGALQRAAARRRAVASRPPSRPGTAPARPAATSPGRSGGVTVFRPDPSKNVADSLADMIGETREERELLREIFAVTRTAFEEEVSAKGRRTDVAAAFTFFIATASMVYHDTPEPDDEDLDELWDGLSTVFEEMPEFAEMSNSDKHEIYETLIAFSGILLFGHVNSKESGDRATHAQYRELAGLMIQTVLQTSPEKVRFGPGGFELGQ